MTVKELIEELQKFDGELEVRIGGTDPTDWDYQNEIEGINESESNWDGEMDFDEEGELIGKKILIIDGGCF